MKQKLCFNIFVVYSKKEGHAFFSRKKEQKSSVKGHNYESLLLISQNLGHLECYTALNDNKVEQTLIKSDSIELFNAENGSSFSSDIPSLTPTSRKQLIIAISETSLFRYRDGRHLCFPLSIAFVIFWMMRLPHLHFNDRLIPWSIDCKREVVFGERK